MLNKSIFDFLRDTFAPFAEEFIGDTEEFLTNFFIIRSDRRDEFMKETKEIKSGIVDIENQID